MMAIRLDPFHLARRVPAAGLHMASFIANASLNGQQRLGDAAGLNNCTANGFRLPSVTITRRADGRDGPGDRAHVEPVVGLRGKPSRRYDTSRTRPMLCTSPTRIDPTASHCRAGPPDPRNSTDVYSEPT